MMRGILFSLLIITISARAQDSVEKKKAIAGKVRQIDSLVSAINALNIVVELDSESQNYPDPELKLTYYHHWFIRDSVLKKFVFVTSIRPKDLKRKYKPAPGNVTYTYYFDQSNLVKAEELFIDNDYKEKHVLWYFENQKTIYHTSKRNQANERAHELLSNAYMLIDLVKYNKYRLPK